MYRKEKVTIPIVKGKVTAKKINGTDYIYYTTGRVYSSEKKRSDPVRVVIGKRCKEDPAYMYPNDWYETYFADINAEEHSDISKKERIRRIDDARNWVRINLDSAYNIPNVSYSKLLALATIDCFAQAWGHFPPANKSNDTFCNFVLSFSSKRDSLRKTCPITLYYEYEKELPDIPLTQGRIYSYESSELEDLASDYLISLPEEERERVRKKHTYIKLLYLLRNKLVHELNHLGLPIEFLEDRPSVTFGRIDQKEVWSLNIPRAYIYNLAKETINNYLTECEKGNCDLPLRGFSLSWYE